jgi:hypothetical protein
MRGTHAIRRLGGVAALAVAGTAVATAPAAAAILPACSAELAVAPAGDSGSCSFDTPYNYATITVVPDGTVSVNVRCLSSWGVTSDYTRTVTEPASWRASTIGSCYLTLTSLVDGTSAVGTATPAYPPIRPAS